MSSSAPSTYGLDKTAPQIMTWYGVPYMTSTIFWDFLTPSPLFVRKTWTVCPQILGITWRLPPSVRTSYVVAPYVFLWICGGGEGRRGRVCSAEGREGQLNGLIIAYSPSPYSSSPCPLVLLPLFTPFPESNIPVNSESGRHICSRSCKVNCTVIGVRMSHRK